MSHDILAMVYILVIGFSVYWTVMVIFSKNEDAKVLQWASGNAPVKSKSAAIELSRTLTHQFTIHHAAKIKNPRYRKSVEYTILTSGLSAEINVDEFLGMKILWGIMLPTVLLILNFAMQLDYPFYVFIALVPMGWYFPNMHAKAMRTNRVTSIRLDMPFFTDLLALATEAGLDFSGAIQRIVEKTRGSGSVLSEEFEQVLRDITLGSSRSQALRGMANRCDMQEVSSFVNVIIDADTTGASISKVLKDQSAQMRLERFVRAEKAGAQASQKILIPLIFFILPAVFVMVFAPIALNFIYGKK